MSNIKYFGKSKIILSDIARKTGMDKELIYKKIDNLIEIRKTLWTILIVLNGGLAGLLASFSSFDININSIIKLFLLIIGGIFDYFFLMSLFDTNTDLNKLYNKLEKEEYK